MQSLDQIWESVLSILQEKSTRSVYDLWFKDLRLVYLDGDKAAVVINSDLKKDIIQKRYAQPLTEALCEVIGFDPPITVLSDEQEKIDPQKIFEEKKSSEPEKEVFSALEEKESLNDPSPILTNDEYTFDNFIVGSSNKLAYAACTAIAKNSSSSFNPLFIYGDSGLGKTHLLYAIINSMKANFPKKNIVYIKGDDFTNELVSSIANEDTLSFRNKYRKADVLLIDDIQFIAGKESTQEEFFHTFNALYEDHKQIILAADRPPKEMKTLEDRLRSRFEWGLIVDVQLPDYELRLAILKNKAKMIGVHIPMPVLQFLAESLHSNIRQLEGAVKKIGAQSFLSGVPVTEEIAKSCIAELSAGAEPQSKTVERIISKVASKYGMTSEDIKSRKKTKEIAYARHICIYIIRNITDMSLPTIGKIFGRDHSTVMASLSVIDNGKKKSPLLDVGDTRSDQGNQGRVSNHRKKPATEKKMPDFFTGFFENFCTIPPLFWGKKPVFSTIFQTLFPGKTFLPSEEKFFPQLSNLFSRCLSQNAPLKKGRYFL